MAIDRRVFLAIAGFGVGGALGAFLRIVERDPERLRPPGAGTELEFRSSCIRCGQCVQACPYGTLRLDFDSPGAVFAMPHLVAREVPCSLCRDHDRLLCIAACPTNALRTVDDPREIRMGTAAVDEATCWAFNGVVCRTCWHACPYPDEAIRLNERLRPEVDPAVCIGCGLCEFACPTEEGSIAVRPRGDGEART